MKCFALPCLAWRAPCPLLSLAQWQWIDKDGRKVFSDQSPPADIPAKNILKQPGVKGRCGRADCAPAASQAARPAPAAPKLSGKDKELRGKEEAGRSRRSRQEESPRGRSRQGPRPRTASGPSRAKASFDSGMPRSPASTPRASANIMDDAARAAETKRLAVIIASDCKSGRRLSSPGFAAFRLRANSPAARTPCLRKRSRRATLGSTLSGRYSSIRSPSRTCCSRRPSRPQMPTTGTAQSRSGNAALQSAAPAPHREHGCTRRQRHRPFSTSRGAGEYRTTVTAISAGCAIDLLGALDESLHQAAGDLVEHRPHQRAAARYC